MALCEWVTVTIPTYLEDKVTLPELRMGEDTNDKND